MLHSCPAHLLLPTSCAQAPAALPRHPFLPSRAVHCLLHRIARAARREERRRLREREAAQLRARKAEVRCLAPLYSQQCIWGGMMIGNDDRETLGQSSEVARVA